MGLDHRRECTDELHSSSSSVTSQISYQFFPLFAHVIANFFNLGHDLFRKRLELFLYCFGIFGDILNSTMKLLLKDIKSLLWLGQLVLKLLSDGSQTSRSSVGVRFPVSICLIGRLPCFGDQFLGSDFDCIIKDSCPRINTELLGRMYLNKGGRLADIRRLGLYKVQTFVGNCIYLANRSCQLLLQWLALFIKIYGRSFRFFIYCCRVSIGLNSRMHSTKCIRHHLMRNGSNKASVRTNEAEWRRMQDSIPGMETTRLTKVGEPIESSDVAELPLTFPLGPWEGGCAVSTLMMNLTKGDI